MSDKIQLSRLFSPIKVGEVELKNRIIMAPMTTRLAADDGFVTEKEKDYFVRHAIGGTALLIVGNVTVVPNSSLNPIYNGIWDDKFIPRWREFVKTLHDAGTKLSIQLSHAGSECRSKVIGKQPVAPSAIVSPYTGEMTRELTKGEIEELTEKFAEAARRARDGGVDMVEIQGSQGFLIHNFMTPLFNKRSDEYGGDSRGRTKFPTEIIKRVKEKAGNDYPVIFRMVASDLAEGGLTLEDTKEMASMFVKAGADALHFTAGAGLHLRHLCMPPVDAGIGCIVDLVAQIKNIVDVPVAATQRIVDPLQAEGIIKDGKADMVSLGRTLLCDPDWPRKAAEGAFEDIRKCIGCCQGCVGRPGKPLACLFNPELGKGKEYEIRRAAQPKKVLVIGGGPAGMEVARVAALRGHEVTVYEKARELGGQWILASIPPKKGEFRGVIEYYITQLEKLGVKITLNETVTPALIEQANPDVVVVATGAVPDIPEIPGLDGNNVVTAHDVLSGRANIVGDRVAVLGGGEVGCETADFLVEQGKKITIIEMLEELALDKVVLRKPFLMQRLVSGGVEVLTSTRVQEIAEHGIITIDKNGQGKNIGIYDTIVLALGAKPVNEIGKHVEGKVSEVYVIGDALEPRNAEDAVAEGARVGREI
jgi:2,4-dienoyl-CoA reductase-like NADH-dependent reductase (Old Yellow Enzyme family)/thioredoxin reductase